MKIPGLTFIFIPIVVWLIFAYGGYVFSEIQEYYTKTSIGEILFTLFITNLFLFALELGVRMMFDVDRDMEDFFSLNQ